MLEVKTSYTFENKPDKSDSELEEVIRQALSMTLEDFARKVMDDVQKVIGGKSLETIYIRCYKTKKKHQGFALKTAKRGVVPDIILGFCGEVEDFEITMLHELLHMFRWDEKLEQRKYIEIPTESQPTRKESGMKASLRINDDQVKSVVSLFPDTNEEMAGLEIILAQSIGESITLRKIISENKRVIAYEFWVGGKK